jgi:hypothetical protein
MSNTREQVTAALDAHSWDESVCWIAGGADGYGWFVFRTPDAPAPQKRRSFFNSDTEYEGFYAIGGSNGESLNLRFPLRDVEAWPGDWRESLHKVIHENGKSRVEWCGLPASPAGAGERRGT